MIGVQTACKHLDDCFQFNHQKAPEITQHAHSYVVKWLVSTLLSDGDSSPRCFLFPEERKYWLPMGRSDNLMQEHDIKNIKSLQVK